MIDLEKKLDDVTEVRMSNAQAPHGRTIVRDRDEASWTPEPHRKLAAHLAQYLAQPGHTPGRAMIEHPSLQTKSVVDTGQHRFLIKPYHQRMWPDLDQGVPTTGWSEMTSQALYHAAGIGHLHQAAHVVHVPHWNNGTQPLLAIHMAPGFREIGEHSFSSGARPDADRLRDQTLKIATMAWLGRHPDQHMANVMADPEHNLLAIDHGLTHNYHPSTDYTADWSLNDHIHNRHGALQVPLVNTGGTTPKAAAATEAWWKEASPAVRATLERRLELIKHPALRQHIRANFMARAGHLDDAVARGDRFAFWNGKVKNVSTPGLPDV